MRRLLSLPLKPPLGSEDAKLAPSHGIAILKSRAGTSTNPVLLMLVSCFLRFLACFAGMLLSFKKRVADKSSLLIVWVTMLCFTITFVVPPFLSIIVKSLSLLFAIGILIQLLSVLIASFWSLHICWTAQRVMLMFRFVELLEQLLRKARAVGTRNVFAFWMDGPTQLPPKALPDVVGPFVNYRLLS